MKKKQMVPLVCGDLKNEYSIEHAEAILNHPTNYDKKGNMRWTIAKDSKFEFVDHGIRVKSDTGKDKAPKVQKADK